MRIAALSATTTLFGSIPLHGSASAAPATIDVVVRPESIIRSFDGRRGVNGTVNFGMHRR